MAMETKVILQLLADSISKAETVKEAYMCVERAANVEGMRLSSFEESRAEWEKAKSDKK